MFITVLKNASSTPSLITCTEIHFPNELDHLFGIQQNKSRFDLDGNLSDIVREIVRDILEQVQRDVNDAAKESTKLRASIGATPVEEDIKKVAPRLPTPTYSIKQVNDGIANRKAIKNATEAQLRLKRDAMLQTIEREVEHGNATRLGRKNKKLVEITTR